jgi:hypothetical protein
MPNFAAEIEEFLQGEPVQGIVVGDKGHPWLTEYVEDRVTHPLMTWEEARPLLDYKCDHSYGVVRCHPIIIWTRTRIIYVECYDGATGLCDFPRHPVACTAYMPGGG